MTKDEFVADYGEYLYRAAYKCYWKLKGKPKTEEEIEIIHDVFTNILETFSTKIDEGNFNFRGECDIRTFFFSSVYRKMRETLYGKVFYPAALKPFGEAGRSIYYHRYILSYPRTEALMLSCQELGAEWDDIDSMDKQIEANLKTSIVKKKGPVSNTEVGENQLEEFVAQTLFAHSRTPEAEVLMSELRTKMSCILENLSLQHRQIIILDQDGFNTEDIQKTLKLKDRQAVYNTLFSAKKAFRKEAENQKLEEWTDHIC